jgi:uncharacterized protein YjiS (DUF1127 family)
LERIMRNIALPLAGPELTPGRVLSQTWRGLLALELALKVRRERRDLASLDERALKDIGFSSGEAFAEAGRSFWDVPADRLRP